MVTDHLFGLLAIVVIAVAWVGVQAAWKKAFPDRCSADPDALAGRIGCHGDGDCKKDCDRRAPTRAGAVQEEIS